MGGDKLGKGGICGRPTYSCPCERARVVGEDITAHCMWLREAQASLQEEMEKKKKDLVNTIVKNKKK